MSNVFKLGTEYPYNLRHISEFSRSMFKSVYHETGDISYLRPKIWDIVPEKLKKNSKPKAF